MIFNTYFIIYHYYKSKKFFCVCASEQLSRVLKLLRGLIVAVFCLASLVIGISLGSAVTRFSLGSPIIRPSLVSSVIGSSLRLSVIGLSLGSSVIGSSLSWSVIGSPFGSKSSWRFSKINVSSSFVLSRLFLVCRYVFMKKVSLPCNNFNKSDSAKH